MAARSGMAYIIEKLRGETDTAEDAYYVNNTAYWSDEQLQDVLDEFRHDVIDTQLLAQGLYVDGTLSYTRYYMPEGLKFLETSDTSGALSIVDSTGYDAPTNTIDYTFGLVTFSADTGGTEYFVRGRQYDLYKAAAKVWFMKAGHRAELINWKGGGYTLSEDQEWQHCMEMYHEYNKFTGLGVIKLAKRGYKAWTGA